MKFYPQQRNYCQLVPAGSIAPAKLTKLLWKVTRTKINGQYKLNFLGGGGRKGQGRGRGGGGGKEGGERGKEEKRVEGQRKGRGGTQVGQNP